MTGSSFHVAALQMDCAPAPVPDRLARAADLIAEAAEAGALLVVLPELFNTGYEFHDRNYALAEPLAGPTITWMQAQAARHGVHVAGSLMVLDEPDIYNAGLLVTPDGRTWRYDKHYVPLWERAYFRGGDAITVADTDLGKLGMMICWDTMHPDLWAQYAGQVDALLIMSCPGNLNTGDLHFPDGFSAPFLALFGPPPGHVPPPDDPVDSGDPMRQQAGWLGVPVVRAAATGTIRTPLPALDWLLQQGPLAERTPQAAETILECGFDPETQIVNARDELLAQGTTTGDGVIMATVELPAAVSIPQAPQPGIDLPPEVYQLADETLPSLMRPHYQEGVRRQWGIHMAPDQAD